MPETVDKPAESAEAATPPTASERTKAWLQVVQLAVTIATGTMAFVWSQQTEKLKVEVQTYQALRSEDRKDQEHLLGLRLKVFELVNKALEGDERQQSATTALVQSLLNIEDPLRTGLLQVLLTEAKPEARATLVEVIAKDEQYRAWLSEARQAAPASQSGVSEGALPATLAAMSVDVFFCADPNAAMQSRRKEKAEQLRQALKGQALVRPNVRELAESVNASPGYRVQGLQLRHEANELAMGKALQELVQTKTQMSFGLRQVANKTPGYLSLFVCD